MNKRKFQIAIEIAWVIMAVFILIIGIYYQIKIGIGKVWLMYALSFISMCMFFVRRMQRKNIEKRNNRFR